jgi:tRNA-Thr(GGU) m(6)t(6)A37 methyltransferase TsaA
MIVIEPIGYVHTERAKAEDDYWGGMTSTIVLADTVDADSLVGIEDFSHAEILFYFNRVDPQKVVTGARHPRNNPDWPRVGIFAQRAKNRPNRLGSTIARIRKREGRILYVSELDAIDQTPVLDIKPVMQEFLPREPVRQPDWSRELMQHYWTAGTEGQS